jgi:hypothetical protein
MDRHGKYYAHNISSLSYLWKLVFSVIGDILSSLVAVNTKRGYNICNLPWIKCYKHKMLHAERAIMTTRQRERIIFGSSSCVNQTTPISVVLVFPAFRCCGYSYSLHAITWSLPHVTSEFLTTFHSISVCCIRCYMKLAANVSCLKKRKHLFVVWLVFFLQPRACLLHGRVAKLRNFFD